MRISLLSGLLLLTFPLFSQGLILNKSKSSKLEQYKAPESFGYADAFPSKISYRAFTPPVQNQGQTATCVGYSVAYGLLTTQQNILMGITNENMKFFRAMDPNFVYALIKSYGDQWCQDGTSMFDAIGALVDYGCKPMFFDPWLDCNSTTEISKFAMAAASNYRIEDAYVLDMQSPNIVNIMKTALNNKRLVAIGAKLTPSFQSGATVQYGSWSPSSSEQSTGGHAMVVIGYDDYKNGGSFEVMNSWGPEFGDNGFVWIKYTDVRKYLDEGYVLEMNGYSTSNCGFGDCANSVSRYRYSSGNVYEGLISNNYPDVYGSYFYTSGNFYVGEFSKGKKHGYGVFYDNSTYQFYLTYYQNDILNKRTAMQGFAEDEEKLNKTIKLYNSLNSINPGKLVTEEDKDFDKLFDLDIPIEDLKIN